MQRFAIRWIALVTLSTIVPCIARAADVRDDYELTMAVAEVALDGERMFVGKDFAGKFADGFYTDPRPMTRAKSFWSNGVWAKVDRDDNGHYETLFVMRDGRLVYFGSIGPKGQIVNTAFEFADYLGARFDRIDMAKVVSSR
ncbi:hypothetical protein [Aeoliella sp. SH292]|uniref:hypothetical protein n=1 Tax=Aeoliella sp. SH292 TaxID=3454464 RepID=UPI003F9C173C